MIDDSEMDGVEDDGFANLERQERLKSNMVIDVSEPLGVISEDRSANTFTLTTRPASAKAKNNDVSRKHSKTKFGSLRTRSRKE